MKKITISGLVLTAIANCTVFSVVAANTGFMIPVGANAVYTVNEMTLSGDDPRPPGAPCSASEVILYAPAKQKDGSEIPAALRNPEKALGTPENSDNSSSVNAVTLGFGGTLVLKMSSAIKNGPGNDFKIFETSGGLTSSICTRHPERIRAYVSQDGCNWVYAGTGCQDVELDLGELNWASFIKIVDISPINGLYQGEPVPNGYDVDGVTCLNGFEQNPVVQDLGALYAVDYSDVNILLRRNGTPVAADRSNPKKALGKPENNSTVNFISLGFGGSIVLELGYIVFDKPGNDIQVVETSFGNPSCNNFPEKASVEVSLDKSSWTPLGSTLCQDGKIDFAAGGVQAVKYLRITDRTLGSRFSGTADAYDLDGVIVLQPGCELKPNAIPALQTENENVQLLNILPGNSADSYLIDGPEEIIGNAFSFQVANLAGQLITGGNIPAQASENMLPSIELQNVPPGIYFVSIQSETHKEVIKLLKR